MSEVRADARFGISIKVFIRELEIWLDTDNISHSGFLLLNELNDDLKSCTVRIKYRDNEFPHVVKARKVRIVDGKLAFVFKFLDEESSVEFNDWLDQVALDEIEGKFLSWNEE